MEANVLDVHTYNGYSKEELLQFAAVAEKNSSHPIADAILEQTKEWGIRNFSLKFTFCNNANFLHIIK